MNPRTLIGVSLLAGLAVVFFGMQILMVGPLQGRLQNIQARLDQSDRSMSKLVKSSHAAEQTNDLLTSLDQQARSIESLRRNIADIQTLRNTVSSEGIAALDAMQAVEKIAAVQQRLIAHDESTASAQAAVEKLESLRQSILNGSDSTEVADSALSGMKALQERLIAASNGYEKASNSIARMSDLTERIIAEDKSIEQAAADFDRFLRFRDSVTTASASLDEANAGVVAFNDLKNAVIASATDLPAARTAADASAEITAMLSQQSGQVNTARENLNLLLSIQDALASGTEQVTSAVQNLEILDEFQQEVTRHISSLEVLRRTLMEIALMESSIVRVAGVIQPLTEIVNLRRLGDDEVREAARVVLDRRNSRVGRLDSETDAVQKPEVTTDGTVPVPVETVPAN